MKCEIAAKPEQDSAYYGFMDAGKWLEVLRSRIFVSNQSFNHNQSKAIAVGSREAVEAAVKTVAYRRRMHQYKVDNEAEESVWAVRETFQATLDSAPERTRSVKKRDGNSSLHLIDYIMTAKEFFDWQTSGGTDDVMKLVAALEKADIPWCAIGGIAVNHWAEDPMVTQDFDLVVASDAVHDTIDVLEKAGFHAERFEWSVNFKGNSAVSVQLSTEDSYKEFPSRAVPADVHGILLRVASLEDTIHGKIRAWSDPARRQSKRIKDLADIARLVESHPRLWDLLTEDLKTQIEKPKTE